MKIEVAHFSPDVSTAIESLVDFLDERFSTSVDATPSSFEQFETELRGLTMALERACHGQELERFDVDAPGLEVNGVGYRRTSQSTVPVTTLAGTVPVRQTVYRQRGGRGGKSVGAVALQAGLIGGNTTVAAARLLCHLVAEMPPSDAVAVLNEFGAVCVSTSTLDRLPKRIDEMWEQRSDELYEFVRVAEAPTLPNAEAVDSIVVSLDGVMVPMKDAEPDPKKSDSTGYREASAATVQLLGTDGERLHVIRFARMPEAHKVSLTTQLQAEIEALLLRYPTATLHAVADGARENWRILGDIEQALGRSFDSQLVDFYHAVEHLCAGLAAVGADEDQVKLKRRELRDRPGAASAVLVELAQYRAALNLPSGDPDAKPLDEQITYFTNNYERMDYAETAASGLPIGSGVQEAACKTLVVERLKQSGMSWRHRGGQAILTLRSLLQSKRFAHAWRTLTNVLTNDVRPVAKPHRKRPAPPSSIRKCG